VRREGWLFVRLNLTLNFRVEVEKRKVRNLSLFFFGCLDFDGPLRSLSPWCPCAEHF
jgi:hypothetical protein